MTLYQQNEEEFVYVRKGKFYKMIYAVSFPDAHIVTRRDA